MDDVVGAIKLDMFGSDPQIGLISSPILERAEIANEVIRAIQEEFPWTGAHEAAASGS